MDGREIMLVWLMFIAIAMIVLLFSDNDDFPPCFV